MINAPAVCPSIPPSSPPERARANDLQEIAIVIRRCEPLTLDTQRLYVGKCLNAGSQFCDAWHALARYLSGREDLDMSPDSQSKLVTIRMSNAMIAAWEAAAEAAGVTKSLWLRRLIEREVGGREVKAEMSTGMGAMNESQRAARLATFKKTIAQRRRAKHVKKKS